MRSSSPRFIFPGVLPLLPRFVASLTKETLKAVPRQTLKNCSETNPKNATTDAPSF
jgi:hypothetical protein